MVPSPASRIMAEIPHVWVIVRWHPLLRSVYTLTPKGPESVRQLRRKGGNCPCVGLTRPILLEQARDVMPSIPACIYLPQLLFQRKFNCNKTAIRAFQLMRRGTIETIPVVRVGTHSFPFGMNSVSKFDCTAPVKKERPKPLFLTQTDQTPTGLAFSGSILYCLIARATSFAVIFPSFASAAIAA